MRQKFKKESISVFSALANGINDDRVMLLFSPRISISRISELTDSSEITTPNPCPVQQINNHCYFHLLSSPAFGTISYLNAGFLFLFGPVTQSSFNAYVILHQHPISKNPSRSRGTVGSTWPSRVETTKERSSIYADFQCVGM